MAANVASPLRLRQFDEGRIRAAGIRKLSSRRLTLYTDLPAEQSVDELPAVFDLAFPQWCAYFDIDPRQHDDWRMTGYLMKDKLRFEAAGCCPPICRQFLNGYTRQNEFWAYDQTSPYYRRHLLLHEGTHGFMYTLLGNVGPPWYAEGMAELLGTHRWQDGQLTLNYFPAKPQEVPKLGRIEIVETEFAARRAMRFTDVLNLGPHAHLKVEPYAWSWAAAAFLDNHPRYRERFRRLPKFVNDRGFQPPLRGDLLPATPRNWPRNGRCSFPTSPMDTISTARRSISRAGVKLPSRGAKLTVAADRGWQNTGVRLEAGKAYDLQASGRYQVGKEPARFCGASRTACRSISFTASRWACCWRPFVLTMAPRHKPVSHAASGRPRHHRSPDPFGHALSPRQRLRRRTRFRRRDAIGACWPRLTATAHRRLTPCRSRNGQRGKRQGASRRCVAD